MKNQSLSVVESRITPYANYRASRSYTRREDRVDLMSARTTHSRCVKGVASRSRIGRHLRRVIADLDRSIPPRRACFNCTRLARCNATRTRVFSFCTARLPFARPPPREKYYNVTRLHAARRTRVTREEFLTPPKRATDDFQISLLFFFFASFARSSITPDSFVALMYRKLFNLVFVIVHSPKFSIDSSTTRFLSFSRDV